MSRIQQHGRLEVPATLEAQLHDFRRRVWTSKMVEGAGVAAASVLAAYLCVFALDRLWDTPSWGRSLVAALALAGCAIVPYYLHRWVWRRRQLEQLARLLSQKLPRVGDQLLGVIELAHSDFEQARSPVLCQAAIEQVAADAQGRDLRAAAPDSRSRFWSAVSIGLLGVAIALAAVFPAAALNAMARLFAPWKNVPRFTFASVEPLPAEIVVPHGEPFSITAHLRSNTEWKPDHARLQVGQQPPLSVNLSGDKYEFAGSPLIDSTLAKLTIGDWSEQVRVVPKLRPELTSLTADVKLPAYLGRPEPIKKDVRGGAVSAVKGSAISFTAAANRELASASVDDRPRTTVGATLATDSLAVAEPRELRLQWQDTFGLGCKEPFKIAITPEDDAPPNISCEDLPRRRVVLDSEQLVFHLTARDDFGLQQVGMEWKGVAPEMVEKAAEGEKLLAPGAHDKPLLDLEGTFSAQSLGIQPQPIELRLYATDYFPGRPRVYSPPYLFYVLDAEQHAIWITEQLSKWHRQSLEVRDRELRLYETNKQLRALSPAELDRPQTRRQVEGQAAAEQANGRRLSALTLSGQELLRQAARNPEIGVGHLDKWAEMLEILKDISHNRMPSVADLLHEASKSPIAASKMPAGGGPKAGQARAAAKPGPGAEAPKREAADLRAVQLVDGESSQQPPDPKAEMGKSQKKNPTSPSLRLPITTVMGNGGGKKPPARAPQKIDEAVVAQKDLLAEFEKVANELNEVLANLEGSTLVKRLKAASREQYRIAGTLGEHIEASFGGPASSGHDAREAIKGLSKQEEGSSQKVSLIMDDMEAYFERRRLVRFKSILDDMAKEDVIGSLRRVADDIPGEQGLSISQCEYWSDAMDRWAEDLVDPACSGACPGCRTKSSLPPSIVLEVLKILEGEINLREETRVAEQARPALAPEKHTAEANRLGDTQHSLDDRTLKVVDRIRELPDAEKEFGKEIALLGQVSEVMSETTGILKKPETGKPAIAAETEAIELLLKSKRINPNGGGGGGANPGGGGGGDTKDTALALLGAGLNQKEVREDRGTEQAVGESGATLPAEFRAGLNKYFSELEHEPTGG